MKLKIAAISVSGFLLINTLIMGVYHWHRVYKEWGIQSASTDWTQPKKIDYGHEPEELALNMDTELLKQMEKAVKNELKYRANK